MKNKRGDHLRKHGLFSGYDEYRHGASKKPTLATVSILDTKPRVSRKEKKSIASSVMDALADWRASPFEHEGTVRHAIRSTMCLSGHSWGNADHTAESVLSEVYASTGQKRPTWDEGQRHATTPVEDCAWCGLSIPDDLMTGKRPARYCSALCAKSAFSFHDFAERRNTDRAYSDVMMALQRTQIEKRICEGCGRCHRPLFENARFCSKLCADAASRVIPDRPCRCCGNRFRPINSARIYCSIKCSSGARVEEKNAKVCVNCGTAFHSKGNRTDQGKYCSRTCKNADMSRLAIERSCLFCDEPFTARSLKARCCSPVCAQALCIDRQGKWKPRTLSRMVFDRLIARPINREIKEVRFSAEIFDTWFVPQIDVVDKLSVT